MPNLKDNLKDLLEKLKQAGKSGIDDFARGAKDIIVEQAEGLLRGGGKDVAERYARTAMDEAALLASEALTGVHEPREWAQIESQDASHNLQGAAILRAARLAFMANVAGLLGGVFGAVGGKVGEAIAATLDGLLQAAKG